MQFEKTKIIKGVAIAAGGYVVHRILKAAYRRGYVKKPNKVKKEDLH